MADTIGDLIDKLSIANIRLWHIEDDRRVFSQMSEDYDVTKNELETMTRRGKELLDMVAKVNKERNSLIDQINASLAVLIDSKNGKNSTVQLTVEELLGTGKNKFYKTEQ
jgi:hypothetical protein